MHEIRINKLQLLFLKSTMTVFIPSIFSQIYVYSLPMES